MLTTEDLTLTALRAAYASGKLTPSALCGELVAKVLASHAVFITKPRPAEVAERCK
jgi:hypothetical protein